MGGVGWWRVFGLGWVQVGGLRVVVAWEVIV